MERALAMQWPAGPSTNPISKRHKARHLSSARFSKRHMYLCRGALEDLEDVPDALERRGRVAYSHA